MNWECNIEKVKNGYIITYHDDETSIEQTAVFEYEEGDNDTQIEQKTLRKVFYFLMDYFAVFNDKHKEQFMDINISGDSDDCGKV